MINGVKNGIAWKLYLVIGGILLVLHCLSLPPASEGALLILSGFLATAVFFLGIGIHRPQPSLVWIIAGVGQAANAAGNIFLVSAYYQQSEAIPNLSTGFYLVGQTAFIIALTLMAWKYRYLINPDTVINGLIVASGLVVPIWVLIIQPNLARQMNFSTWAVTFIYPAGVLAVIVPMTIYMLTSIGKIPSFRFLFGTVLFYAISLGFFGQIVMQQEPIFSSADRWLAYFNDATSTLAYVCLGTAALHPSIAAFNHPFTIQKTPVTRLELVLFGISFLITPFAFFVRLIQGHSVDFVAFLVSTVAVFLLVLWRLARLVTLLELHNRQLNRQQEQLHYQVNHDPLTQLPNRLYLYKHLSEMIDLNKQFKRRGAVLMIDLNHFKEVNDRFGHSEGDDALVSIAQQFSHLTRRGDLVARWGGDEFVFVLQEIGQPADAIAFAQRMSQSVRHIASRAGANVEVSASIGICLFPNGSDDVDNLLQRADKALYQAKAQKQEKIALYGQLS